MDMLMLEGEFDAEVLLHALDALEDRHNEACGIEPDDDRQDIIQERIEALRTQLSIINVVMDGEESVTGVTLSDGEDEPEFLTLPPNVVSITELIRRRRAQTGIEFSTDPEGVS